MSFAKFQARKNKTTVETSDAPEVEIQEANTPVVEPLDAPEEEIQETPDAPVVDESVKEVSTVDISAMSKEELDEYAMKEFEIKLDRRQSKSKMLKELKTIKGDK